MLEVASLEREVWTDYQPSLSCDAEMGSYILILGHPGSGKTTAARKVAEVSSLHYTYDAALLSQPRLRDYTRRLFSENDSSYFLAYEIEALAVRFLQSRHADAKSICDQGIHSIWAYARALVADGRLSHNAYQSFFAVFITLRSVLPWPRLVVRFRCDPSDAWDRVIKRNREHELLSLNENFISHLDQQYEYVISDFPSLVSKAVLDTSSLSPERTATQLRSLVDASFSSKG